MPALYGASTTSSDRKIVQNSPTESTFEPEELPWTYYLRPNTKQHQHSPIAIVLVVQHHWSQHFALQAIRYQQIQQIHEKACEKGTNLCDVSGYYLIHEDPRGSGDSLAFDRWTPDLKLCSAQLFPTFECILLQISCSMGSGSFLRKLHSWF